MEWKNIYRGFIMGISDLIPGVSGGTIAVILGIYNQLLEAISGFFSREWKQQLRFLVPLGIGVASALLILSKLIKYVLEHYYVPTQFFFMALVIGVIPMLFKESGARTHFKWQHISVLL
ncbi:undecaprenyl phosphate translocase family protein, partial [Cohnella sp.]|uniref:undecaprenyl phosphate translocase family protein n=1 Tax=Cohnella sp. TaxID=1883426 RepID=UPI00356206B2